MQSTFKCVAHYSSSGLLWVSHLAAGMADLGKPEQRSTLQRALAMLASLGIQRPRKHSYHDIADSECEKLTDADELEDPRRPRRQYFNINIWFFTTTLLLTFSIAQTQNVFRSHSRFSRSYETGFNTDLPDAQRTIQVEKHRFTAALRDHSNGSLYMVSDTSKPQYVGLPTPAIDANWDALTHGMPLPFSHRSPLTLFRTLLRAVSS